jgi:hypothetical protein
MRCNLDIAKSRGVETPGAQLACAVSGWFSSSQLREGGRLLELCSCSGYLTHEERGRRVLNEEVRRARGHQHNAEPLQVVVPGTLDSEITGKAIWALDSSLIIAISLRHGGPMWNVS